MTIDHENQGQPAGERPPFKATGPVRNLRGKREVKQRPNPQFGPVGPMAPSGKPLKPRFVPLRAEYCAICQDGGGPDLDAAIVLQQLCRMQAHVADRAAYVEEETHHARARPRRVRGGTAGWFPASAAKLSKELFGAVRAKSVERAIVRLQEMGVVQARPSTRAHVGKQANEYRVDAVRLAELLAGAGYGLPDNEWGPKGLGFDPGKVAPETGPEPPGTPRQADDPSRQNDESIGQIDDPRFDTVTNEESEDTDTLSSENPLNPPKGDFSFRLDLKSFDPADVSRWQAESMALVPAGNCTKRASREFVNKAPVARLMEALYPGRISWNQAFARRFTNLVQDGRVTVARILACAITSFVPGIDEFLEGEGFGGEDERSSLAMHRPTIALPMLWCDPSTRELLGDLAHEADGWADLHHSSLCSAHRRIVEEAAGGTPPGHSITRRTGFRDAMLTWYGSVHPVAPVEPEERDQIRENVLRDCAESAELRYKILALDPAYLADRLGLTPEAIQEEAAKRRKALVDEWMRCQAVYDALT